VRAAVRRVVAGGDLATLTRRGVLAEVGRLLPGFDPDEHRAAVADEITRALAAA
jgi:hypothetical protein